MPIDLQINWEGLGAPAYARRFRQAALIKDFSPALRKIALVIASAIETNFEKEGRPKWTPLAESTIQKKIALGYFSPHAILVATGALWSSATDPSEYVITRDTIIAEPAPIYWIYHQRGTREMPQRIVMNLQRGDQRKIGGIFNEFIKDHLRKNGLRVRGNVTFVGGGSADF